MKAIVSCAMLMLALVGCQSTEHAKLPLYQAQDWVDDGVFTTGVEGPAVDKQGVLYAVNYSEQGTIGQVVAQNQASLYVNLPNGSVGNGIRFDRRGNMYVADYKQHNILQITPDKQVSVFAHEPEMNQPNDIAITDDGTLYASDPNWQEGNGQVWRIRTNGQVERLKANMGTTNGIEVSPDNAVLYVNESVQRRIWAFPILQNGQLGEAKLFYQFDDHGLDGMRTDERGNLYIARYGAGEVVILSPQGKMVNTVKLKGQFPTNIAFGGESGRQVFVTMQKRGAIETFYSEHVGRAMNTL
ncbi:SMP-30/gluconolactonase/LRE family protein [Pseudoalteromonas luteoviolacea]|uniref:SMP-30/gluconolactonase/LRE family protein n=1 Tax=Pseudoalteromonas luteoviolacea TaxID=43657 RepID=UPI001B38A05F|nr:SMP-30/gluconolactonase/LRE family protein [Pseudoalteromonas luteoviolacea]MBQ4836416.1 SMP-30/gluconolactonase/LRE family protein [Pseudoalteromonas luteoviolacea]